MVRRDGFGNARCVDIMGAKQSFYYEPTVPLASIVRQAEEPLASIVRQATRPLDSLELANQDCQPLYTVLCVVQSMARQSFT